MKPLIVFATIALMFAAGALYMVKDGVEAQPTRIMDPTNFSKPADLGVALARRFYNELQMKRVFILGESEHVKAQEEIWKAFVAEAENQGVGFTVQAESVEQALALHEEGARVFMQMDSNLDMRKQLQNSKLLKFVIFLSPYAPNKDLMEKLPVPCTEADSQEGTPCLAKKASLAYSRRHLSVDQFGAMMEKYSVDFGVLFVWEPH
jgi:hypothetical protein